MGWCLEVAREEISPTHLRGTWENLSVCSCFVVQACKRSESVDYKPFCCMFCKEIPSFGVCCLCSEHTYRIIFRGLQKLVIATAPTRTEINLYWEQVKSDLQPMVTLLEKEQIKTLEKKQPKPTAQKKPQNVKWNMWKYKEKSKETSTTPMSVSKQIQDFIMIKISALIKDDFEFHKNIRSLNEEYFRKQFNEYTQKEKPEISTFN